MGLDAFARSLPVFGGMYSTLAGPSDEEQALQQQFQNMAHAYEQYRGQHADARERGLQSQLSMFGPMQQYLSAMMPDIQPFNTQGVMDQFHSVTSGMGPAVASQAAPAAPAPTPGFGPQQLPGAAAPAAPGSTGFGPRRLPATAPATNERFGPRRM